MFKGLDTGAETSVPTAGALKRSDANVDSGTERTTSPVAKRRSLHGVASFGGFNHDAHVFEYAAATPSSLNFEIHDESNQEYQLTGSPAVPFIRRDIQPSPTPSSSVARRSSSLRKSTLQQRYGDKGSWGRRMGAQQLAQMSNDTSTTPNSRNRPRISLDAPSASGNSFQEDTPMKFSEQATDNAPNRKIDPFRFSLGARPTFADTPGNLGLKSQTPRSPRANPRTGMFMSTGLISKVNRDPEDDKRVVVPDTPCKKHSSSGFATYPPHPGSAVRFGRRPSSPIFHSGPPDFGGDDAFGGYGNAGRGLSLFHRMGGRPHRRASVLDLNAEMKSPAAKAKDGRTTPEGLPPTPTKPSLTPTGVSGGDAALESPSTNRFPPPISAVQSFASREPSPSPIRLRDSPTPMTPRGGVLPLDPSRLSIHHGASTDNQIAVPVTPTTSQARRLITPVHSLARSRMEVDEYLLHKFARVDEVGQGEFSTVYRVAYAKQKRASVGLDFRSSASRTPPGSPPPGKAFAVKKSRRPFQGLRDREAKLKEVRILKALSNGNHVLHYINSWEIDNHLYIQTEYCDEGTLEKFLGDVGRQGRLDDFRIWKILHDLSLGLQEIHQAGFIHLDMKPANVLITFEGVLRIGDFGLATEWPAAKGIDAEGDREYIGPEILKGQFDKPADMFSLGLIALEISANVQLPENGPSWLALRNGDFSDIPSLTTGGTVEGSIRATPTPTSFEEAITGVSSPTIAAAPPDFGVPKHTPLTQPPQFMADAGHPFSLDHLVRQLTQPEPSDRLTVDAVLQLESLRWVATRRRCPATVFEGLWGPDDSAFSHDATDYDTEMTDV
ncbi:related to protein kinase SWE1 [Cephalotrichum gorgonifer]|uniref:Related to protein kinase SWE1 n=1 Tax=Cephalotrichum gorgonifer TaxID=2041049 RepID=A0AAE8SR79_9PEZI|nr:related to protein kinase SWE1 [Cephalotrichum gorgonifer]